MNNFNDITTKYINPTKFKENLNTNDIGLNLILADFKRTFILIKMYPESQDYQQQFNNVINNLKQHTSNNFILSNDIQVNIDNISNELLILNALIHKERKKNKEFKIKLAKIENTNNISTEMNSNYKYIYNIKYLRNWALLLSTFFCIYTISVIYKK
jgi:hypothetical protein